MGWLALRPKSRNLLQYHNVPTDMGDKLRIGWGRCCCSYTSTPYLYIEYRQTLLGGRGGLPVYTTGLSENENEDSRNKDTESRDIWSAVRETTFHEYLSGASSVEIWKITEPITKMVIANF